MSADTPPYRQAANRRLCMVELPPQVGTNTVAQPCAPQEFPPVTVCAKPLPCPDHGGSFVSEREKVKALRLLTPDLRDSLASRVGLTLAELDATFELLPLGSRLALERVGAVVLGEDTGIQKTLPFALALVEAAADPEPVVTGGSTPKPDSAPATNAASDGGAR